MRYSHSSLEAVRSGQIDVVNEASRLPRNSQPPEPARISAEENRPFGVMDLLYLLRAHRLSLLSFAVAGILAAVLFTLGQTPLYRARTSLQIQDFNENFLDLKNIDPTDSNGNYLTAESYFQTQVKILESESLIERVVRKLNLRQTPKENRFGTLLGRARRLVGLSTTALPDEESLVRQVQTHLSVRTAGDTRLLEVLYESPDRKLAADVANTLVSEFIQQNQEIHWQSTQRTGEWLTSHLEEMKTKLERSEGQLQQYAQTSGLIFSSDKESVAQVRLKELQDELSKAEADRISKQAKFDQLKNRAVDSLPEMLDDPTLRDYNVKLTDLNRQLVELTATLTPAHYKVKRIQAQINQLASAVEKQRRLILRGIGNEYSSAARREQVLRETFAAQEKEVGDQSSKAIRYDTLKREVDSTRRLYEAMLERVKQAQLASAMRVSNVLVVDPAKPPSYPYRPRPLMNLALGLCSGIFAGLAFVSIRGYFDQSIHSPGESQLCLKVPELGVLPLADRSLPVGPSTKLNSLNLATHSVPELASSNQTCPELAMRNTKPSLLSECVRGTVTSIFLSQADGICPRTIVLTSACRGDGKTTVATNLSIALAETGQRVLLIDGDLRRPRLHSIFGIPSGPGLTEVLSGMVSLEASNWLTDLTVETEIRGVWLLPSGNCSSTGAAHFFSPHASHLVAHARREFDIVIIDAPPMSQLTDARLLARLSDGVILVLRAGRTSAQSASILSRRFTDDGTRVLGTVLNGWNPKNSSGYYQAYYEGYSAAG